ncbi:HAD-IA family hydrolase [Metallumcola ferriviriculae]|uniref:HAD-IA family hydrolase n=1 Tax=Metallumcola ferriviriculae TaxID=3039180 RepID=A0AAU0URZ0_9FIRM|nr:HAD-IA family hydrolase [Desulfitibacteraceae bacterium MK1]
MKEKILIWEKLVYNALIKQVCQLRGEENMLTTILFDLDGTVTNSLPLIKQTYAKVFKEMGLNWGNDDVMRLIGLPLKEIGRQFAGELRVEEFFDRYQYFYRREHNRCMEVYPGTEELLNQLGKQFTLAIVTSKSKVGTEMTLDFLKLKNKFSVVITADDVEKHKPDPEPVEKALASLDAHPDEAVFIGDSPFDIVSGNNAGVTTIAVSWGMADAAELNTHLPNYLVSSREQLSVVIEKIAQEGALPQRVSKK